MISLVIILVSVLFYFIWNSRRKQAHLEKHLSHLDGPKPWPLIGNALDFKTTVDFLPTLMKYQEKYGTRIKLYIGPEVNLLISDCKFLEFLLTTNKILNKSNVYKFLDRWIGTGLLTAGSEKWRKHRKIITPAFHFQILEQFIEVFDANSNILVNRLNSHVNKEEFDIFLYITLCALDVICETAMGASVNAQENSDSEYVLSVNEMCTIISERSFSPIQQYECLYKFTKNYRREKKALKVLHGYTKKVIMQKKSELRARRKSLKSNDNDIGIKKKKAFLDLLLEANLDNNLLTDEEIQQEVDTFMFEGHDTTASAMSFALYNLSKYPDIQEKVWQEQRKLFGDNKKQALTLGDLQEMKYLEMVCKETLRLYPSVPIYARATREDVPYSDGILPKDLPVIVFAYGLHRNPEYYPNPEIFDPDRFSAENSNKISPYCYLPFSAGHRNCIGQKFALLEMKSIISKVIRNFEILPVQEHEPLLVSEVVLKSANGLLVKLLNRQW